jgi:uncharacterized protein (DUF2237 family)
MGNNQPSFIKNENDWFSGHGHHGSSTEDLGSSTKYKLNILGTPLKICNINPITGYIRSGKCEYNIADEGTHLVCGIVNNEFLRFTKSRGNDLISARGEFPGLKNGDRWCFCVNRWIEAYEYDPSIAPRIVPESTHIKVLKYIPMRVLEKYFI